MAFVWENTRADSDQKWAIGNRNIGELFEVGMDLDHPAICVILHTSAQDAIIAVPHLGRMLRPNAKRGCSEWSFPR